MARLLGSVLAKSSMTKLPLALPDGFRVDLQVSIPARSALWHAKRDRERSGFPTARTNDEVPCAIPSPQEKVPGNEVSSMFAMRRAGPPAHGSLQEMR
jgi:hypothetical protein